jgi:hypothetical protein
MAQNVNRSKWLVDYKRLTIFVPCLRGMCRKAWGFESPPEHQNE